MKFRTRKTVRRLSRLDNEQELVQAILKRTLDEWYRLLTASPREQQRALVLDDVLGAHVDRVVAACGGSKARAGRILNVNRRTLQRRLRSPEAARGERRRPGRQPRIDGSRVVAMRAAGKSWKEIAARFECTPAGARLAARRAGGAPSTRGRKAAPSVKVAARETTGALDAVAAKLLTQIKRTPGLRSEQLRKAAGLPAASARAALARLRANGMVRTRGERRGTKYSPVAQA